MPRKDFIATFPENETNLDWLEKHIRAKRKHSSQLAKLKDDIVRTQKKLIAIEKRAHLSISEIKEINRQMRSEEQTSALQSLMRISYAVFCLKKKTKNTQ